MAEYWAKIEWKRGDAKFIDNKYSRGHTWTFDGGVTIPASSSPHVVPVYSDPSGVDPEEAYVASLSSCHMLTFLWVAAKSGFTIDSYVDEARGIMAKNAAGKFWVSQVTLHPKIVFLSDKQPDRATLDKMHHQAHADCFIANSVKTEVICEPVL
jgi:organic hydroperoxide reductase OsmC/OhrA